MGKMKERKSESWKPAVVQDAAFISKNKKRKEKRLSKSLIAENLDTSETTPATKKALGPLNKIIHDANGSLSPKGKKENKFLSTSLPVKCNTKFKKGDTNQSFSLMPSLKGGKKVRRMSEMLGNLNESKTNKFTTKKGKAEPKEFIDSEAEEGEEPVDEKEVKPYVKNSKKTLKNKTVDDSDSDEGSVKSHEFLDMEASEGEETDDEDSGNAEECDSEDSDNEVESNANSSEFIGGSDEDEEEDDSSGDEEEENDSDDDEDKKQEDKLTKVDKLELPQKKKDVKKGQKNSPAEKPSVDVQEKLDTKKTVKQKGEKSQINKSKNTNGVTEPNQSKQKDNENVEKPSKFVGFIRGIPETISKKQLKEALCTKIDGSKIVQIDVKKDRSSKIKNNFFIYVADSDSLEELLNHKFTTGEITFTVYKARETTKSKDPKPIAFLPRVPLSISDELLKETIEKETLEGSVLTVKNKKVNDKYQNRNVIIHMSDVESLKKIVIKGVCMINGTSLIVREAFEAGLKIPTYKVVFSLIPSKTSIAVLKKSIESKIGKGSVNSIRFSLHNDTFAFVVFANEEAQKKSLNQDHGIAINGVQLQTCEFSPRQFKKRSAPSEKAKAKKLENRKNKKQKLAENAATPSPKKMERGAMNNTPAKPKKSKAESKQSNENDAPSSNGKQNEKNKKKKTKHFQHEHAKVQAKEKKKVLTEKIQAKKKILKDKKNKKKKSLNASE